MGLEGHRGAVFSHREKEIGGWAEFDWMLDGRDFKYQPIGFCVFCFFQKPVDGS
jgi:hypothetical protein